MFEPLDVVVNSPGHAFQSRVAQVTARNAIDHGMNVIHTVIVYVRLNRILLESRLRRGLDNPPKTGSDPVLDIVVDPVGHEGRFEGRQIELQIQDVAWEGIGDFERVEMEVAEMGDVVDVVEILLDVLNPRGMDRDKGRHDVIVFVVVFDVVINVHHFER